MFTVDVKQQHNNNNLSSEIKMAERKLKSLSVYVLSDMGEKRYKQM